MSDAVARDVTNHLKIILKSMKYDLYQNILSLKSPTSLEDLALAKIATYLWMLDDTLDKIVYGQLRCDRNFEYAPVSHMKEIEKELLRRVSLLDITDNCKENLRLWVKTVREEFTRFLSSQKAGFFACHQLPKNKKCLKEICWTYQGRLNTLKTVERYIENSNKNIPLEYCRACGYCLEGKIRTLYDQLPTNSIDEIAKLHPLIQFWTYHISGQPEKCVSKVNEEHPDAKSIANYIFKQAVRALNIAAIQHIYRNFGDKEIDRNLVGIAFDYQEDHFDDYRYMNLIFQYENILVYLISQMDDRQIEVMCEGNIYKLLSMILECERWQDVFLPIAKYAIENINKMNYRDALYILLNWNDVVFERRQRRQLISMVKIDDKYTYMYDEKKGIKDCEKLRSAGKSYLVKEFVRGMFSSEAEVEEYREKVLSSRRFILLWT